MESQDRAARRSGLWLARSMSRTDLTPLGEDDVAAIDAFAEERALDAGTVLLREGAWVEHISVVRSGEVHLMLRQSEGGRQTVGVIAAGGVVGDVPFFCRRPMPFTVIAAEGGAVVLEFGTDALLGLLPSSSALSLRWITSVAERLETTQRRMMSVLTRSLLSQVATVLLEHRVRLSDGSWAVLMAQETIADLLGARRQSVSRVLADLRNDGAVTNAYRRIVLLDLDRLAHVAGEPLERIPCGQTMGIPHQS